MTKEKACSNCAHYEKSNRSLPYSGCRIKDMLLFWEPCSFRPEYFSGVNWKDAEKLIGKIVEVSNDGESWLGPDELKTLYKDSPHRRFVVERSGRWTYIRTTPETYQTPHPTITIGGVELPMPEVTVPEHNTYYWLWKPGAVVKLLWLEWHVKEWLAAGRIHLTEARAQAWENWWSDTVVQSMKGA